MELGRVGTLFQEEAARIFRATRPGTELRWRSDLGALSAFALGGCGVWQPHFQGPVCVAEERVLLFARPRSSDERPSEDCDLRMCVHPQAVLAAVRRRRPLCEHMPPVGDFPPGLVSWLSVPVPKEVQEAFREDLLMEDEEPYWRRGRIPATSRRWGGGGCWARHAGRSARTRGDAARARWNRFWRIFNSLKHGVKYV